MNAPLMKTPEALECVAHECPAGVALKAAWAVAEAAWPLVERGWEGINFHDHEKLVEAFRPLVVEWKADQAYQVKNGVGEQK